MNINENIYCKLCGGIIENKLLAKYEIEFSLQKHILIEECVMNLKKELDKLKGETR